jgi:lipopolysaccharide transport system permease protein
MVANLWRYRSFIFGMVKREFQARYLNSLLGSVWAVLNPLATILIYVLIFGRVMKTRLAGGDDPLAYGIFLCAGVLTWGMFTETINRCVTIFIEQANLLKKMSFPRATLPAIVLVSALLNFAIVFAVLLCFLAFFGRFPGASLVALIPLIALQQGMALGLGVTLGVVNVFFRDVGHVVAIGLQLWFWFTPIVYPLAILGERTRELVALNPLTPVVGAYQAIVIGGHWPQWSDLWFQAALALLALAFARLAFRRLAGEMVDYL